MRFLIKFIYFILLLNCSVAFSQVYDSNVCLNHFDLVSLVGKPETTAFSTQKFSSILSNNSIIQSYYTDGFYFDGINLSFASGRVSIGTDNILTFFTYEGRIVAFDYMARKSCIDEVFEACSDIFSKKRIGRTGFQWNDNVHLYFSSLENGNKMIKGMDYVFLEPMVMSAKYQKKSADSLLLSGIEKVNKRDWKNAILDFESGKSLHPSYSIKADSLIANAKKSAVDYHVSAAEQNISRKLYFIAREDYVSAAQYSNNRSYYIRLADEMQVTGIKHRIDPMVSDAKNLAKNGNLHAAIKLLKEALSFDSRNIELKKLIEEYETSQNHMMTRSTKVFKYDELLPANMESFKSAVESSLIPFVDTSDTGGFKSRLVFNFDTLGIISHKIDVFDASFSSQGLIKNWRSLTIGGELLKPTVVDTFFMASSDTLSINASWSKEKFVIPYKVNKKMDFKLGTGETGLDGDVFSKQLMPPSGYRSCSSMMRDGLYDFIETEHKVSGSPLVNGKFEYEIKHLTFNDDDSYEVTATGFLNNSGPVNVFYSLVMPGWGTRKVYPEKRRRSTTRFLGFVAMAGMAVISKMESDRVYDQYLQAQLDSDQNTMDDLYFKSDLFNKAFLASAGIAGTIYLVDVIDVIVGGARNNRFARSLDKRLKERPLKLYENGRFI
jgi:hypothetical protein